MQRVLNTLSAAQAALSGAARRSHEAAVASARQDDREAALAHLEEALDHDPEVPAGRLIAAQVRYALGQYQIALDELDRAAAAGAEAHADELRYRFVTQLGWNQEARELIERRVAAGGGRLWLGRGANLFGGLRHDEEAHRYIEALLEASPPTAALELNAGHLAARRGDFVRAREHALRATAIEPERGALRAAAALLLGEGGHFREAVEEAEHAQRLSDNAPSHALRACLSLWAGRLDEAEAHARRARERDPAGTEGLRIRGAIAVLRGEPERALGDLEVAVRRDPEDPEARIWRAEAFLRTGRFDAAAEEVDRALGHTDRHLFAGQVVRLLATLRGEAGARDRLLAPSFGELRAGCAEIVPEATAVFAEGERAAVIDVLERVLARLGGNRSDRPTWIEAPGAEPRPIHARTGARHASRRALDLIRVASPDDVLRRLDAAIERYPESSLPLAHRGEANIWLGRYDEGLQDLEGALSINTHTRWAYIGMTALEIVAGRYEAALEVSALGVERMRSTGPAVYVHRGEALRRLGRHREAVADLETALELNPRRISATMNLILAWQSTGADDRAAGAYRALIGQAPGLLSDAALAIGVDRWDDPALAPEDRARLLERALELMRGNRSSSCHTYVTDRGVLRTVPTGAGAGPPRRDQEALALEHAAGWLERRRPRSARRPRGEARRHRRDVELLAVRAGLRSAVRATVLPEDVEASRARYEAAGLVSIVAPSAQEYDGRDHVLVFAGRTEEDARRALDAETSQTTHRLGRLLGYPECCIEAFASRDDARSAYEGARAAWVPRPLPRLNNLLFGVGARYISFEPCRYDCPRAAEVADAIAAVLREYDEESWRWSEAQLAQAVLVDAPGAHVVVELEGDERRRIARAVAVPTFPGEPIPDRAHALAERAAGAAVTADGHLHAEWPEATVVVDFARRSAEG